jgi:hypothetical protein
MANFSPLSSLNVNGPNPNSITQNFNTMSRYILIRRGEPSQFMRKTGPETMQPLLINDNIHTTTNK